jgi:transglutaminase-like putative cysteine protease
MKLPTPLIYSLTLSILLVIAPHAEHLPPWVSILCVALLAWRGYLAYRGAPLPPRWLLMLITLVCVALIGKSYHTLFGREVGVTLLMLLATLKLLELRGARDAMTLIYLSCFIIITNFFYSQSIPTALLMLLSLLVIVASWLRIQAPGIAWRPQLRIASILLLQALPLMLVLFVLFPRVQGPLWGLPQDAYSRSGLDDNMAPGSLSKLTLSEAVAFRVTYASTAPRQNQMYWRGPVLWQYDGRTWTRGSSPYSYAPHFEMTAQPVSYSVVLEPHNKPWLYALDVPATLPVKAHLNADFQLLNNAPVTARMRYEMSSTLQYRANVEEGEAQLQRGLQLPPRLNPRTLALAAEWRAQQSDPAELVKTALRYFNQQNFSYTLEPPLLGSNGMDDFLFQTRQGFCEHYASAFVYLMRAAGIPSRVVTGYQGGEYNSFGNYYIVRQSDAHAWAEVWLAGRGWVRVDPTAAIAPERVERNLAASLKDNAALPFMSRNPPLWLSQLRMNIDALSNSWNLWVLGYDPERQFALLTRLGMEDVSWQKMARNLMLGLALVVALLTAFIFRHLYARNPDQIQAAWLRLCKRLAKAGLPRAAHEGALDYARRVGALRPTLAPELQVIAQQYVQLRYGVVPEDKPTQQAFIQSIARFKVNKT